MSTYKLATTMAVGSAATILYVTAQPEPYGRNGHNLLFMPKNNYIGINRERMVFSNTLMDMYNGVIMYQREIEYFWKTGIVECTIRNGHDHVKTFSMDMSADDYIKQYMKLVKKLGRG